MSDREDLERDGYVVVRNFYDPMEVASVGAEISLLGRGPAMYEGAKQVPALYRMIASPKSLDLIQELRPGFLPGVAEGGIQVRADMPNDERWRTHWHQDGTFQGRSADGLTFWTPLMAPVTPDMGPVEICVGSHKAGLLPIYDAGDADGLGRTRSYTWEIEGFPLVVAQYEIAAPLTNPGDVLILDGRTIHRSGQNTSELARWACLWRYFDYDKGRELGWRRPAKFGPQAT